LEEYIDAWNRQDVEGLISFFTEDVVYIDQAVGVDLNLNTVGGFLRGFIGNYSVGFTVTVTGVCESVSEEKFSYEWDVEGTSKAGVKMFIRGISMLEMRGNKIKRNVDYWNYAHSPKHAANS